MSAHSCIACEADRIPGSGFCQPHHDRHESSPWVIAWRKYQESLKTNPNALWADPAKETDDALGTG